MDDRQWYVFTFGSGQRYAGRYVKFFGTYYEARQQMIDLFGLEWAFQYSQDEWDDWVRRVPPYMVETELKVLQ